MFSQYVKVPTARHPKLRIKDPNFHQRTWLNLEGVTLWAPACLTREKPEMCLMETKQEETKFSIHKNPQHASKLFVFHTRRSFALRIKKARKIPPVEKKKKKSIFTLNCFSPLSTQMICYWYFTICSSQVSSLWKAFECVHLKHNHIHSSYALVGLCAQQIM